MIDKRLILLGFYLGTPAFFLLDIVFDWNMRIAALDQYPGWKILYYLLLMGIGFSMWKWPVAEALLGIVEGGVNMLLLTLSVLLPYFQAIEALSSGQSVQTPVDAFSIINYLISGFFLIISMLLRSGRRFLP